MNVVHRGKTDNYTCVCGKVFGYKVKMYIHKGMCAEAIAEKREKEKDGEDEDEDEL
jgi:hypothetical protein